MNKICVYTVTYNRAGFLKRAIDSVLSQSFDDFVYLLYDNGSTDETLDICREYSKKDPRVRVIHEDRNSVSRGFHNAMSEAKKSAQYFIQFDDDDYAEPDMLGFVYNNAEKYDADISMCGSYTVYQDGSREPYFIYDDVYVMDKYEALIQLLSRKLFNVAPPTKLYRSTIFDDSFKDEDDERITISDIHLTYKMFERAEKIVAHGIPKYYFYKHGGNVTSYIQENTLTPELLEEYLWAFKNRTCYLSRRVPKIKDFVRYTEWSYMLSMCNKINTFDIKGSSKQYERMLCTIKKNYDEFSSSPYITAEEKALLQNLIR